MVSLWKCFKSKRGFFFLMTLLIAVEGLAFSFAKKQIQLGSKTLVVEIAETDEQHQRGLMYRDKLSNDEGMLFIFKEEAPRFFWMKNTLIDLSIGYFDKNGDLIDIQEMKSGKGIPDSALPSYPSAKPAKFALEMRKGWFAENKIKIGSKLKVP